MSYSVHIERHDASGQRIPINLNEWTDAVTATEGVRLASGETTVQNTRTGEVIKMPNSGGEAEVHLLGGDEWQRVFSWSALGKISFRAPKDFADSSSPLRSLARTLAGRLSASLVGDEGEIYE